MKRKRHTPQEIIAKLREAEVELNQGATIEAVCRKLEISEQTFHRWRHEYGGLKGPEMARMKELEKENARLKKIVAQQLGIVDCRNKQDAQETKPQTDSGDGGNECGCGDASASR